MMCGVCGGEMRQIITDLPFKVTERNIVILKQLPVIQCERCSEYLLDDAVFARVEELLGKANPAAELEIISFAA